MFSSNKPKLLSDENIPVKLTELLKKRAENSSSVKKVPLKFSDKEISKIVKSELRIILTFDKHFINKRLFPPKEHSGIIFLDIHPPLIDTILSSLSNLFEKVKLSEFKGKLFILSSFGFRIRR